MKKRPQNSIKKVRISLDPPADDPLDLSIFEKSAEMYENPYHQITPNVKSEMSLTSEKIKKLDS